MGERAPSLVITVDTEPDDQWAPALLDGTLPPFTFANTRGIGRLAAFLHERGVPLAPYTLTASLEQGPPDLEQEPNDDPQHATPIETTATGYLAPAGDLDWYRVHSEKPAVLRAEVTGLERADIELAVYGPAAQPAGRRNPGNSH